MLSLTNAENDFNEYSKTAEFISDYKRYYDGLLKISKKFSTQPLPSLFHPVILSAETLKSLKQQSEKMAVILKKTVNLYLNNTEVQSFFQFPETLHNWICIDPGYDNAIPISRYDGFWDGTLYKFCEFNTDGTSGMDEINTLDEAFLTTKIGQTLKEKYSLSYFNLRFKILETLLKTYKDYEGKEKPNIAIIDFLELATIPEFKALQELFTKQGYPTIVCDIRNLKLQKDGLWHKNFKIDLIYRRAVTDDMFPRKDNITDFLEAYKEHAVCVVGPLCSHIAHTKLALTFLTSETAKKFFTEKELDFINNHVPWTRELTDDKKLINDLISNKDEYFLKPHNSNSGKGVCAGEEYNQEEWSKLTKELLMKQDRIYLVQKKIPIPTDNFVSDIKGTQQKYNVNLSSYIFNNSHEGFFTRVSSGSVINTDRGASVVPLFKINE